MKKIADALYFAWAIALKDVRDAFKNRATRTNILVLVGLVVFFYWMSNLRPFDTRVNVVVLDQGSSSLPLQAVNQYPFGLFLLVSFVEFNCH